MDYRTQLADELVHIETRLRSLLQDSKIIPRAVKGDLTALVRDGGLTSRWAPSDPAMMIHQMDLLSDVRDWFARFWLLFPESIDSVRQMVGENKIIGWLDRRTYGAPQSVDEALADLRCYGEALRHLLAELPGDPWAVRAVVDTDVLIDNPDLAAFEPSLGGCYLVHVPPAVLGQLDDLKMAGRDSELREKAKKAVRRLKGLRHDAKGPTMRVRGDIYAVFDHIDPRAAQVPHWLNLDLVDDRIVASALVIQSQHPGSRVVVVTGDINLQNKVLAARLTFLDPETITPDEA